MSSATQRIWFCNVGSDLHWTAPGTLPSRLQALLDELPWHFAFAADPGDRVLFPKPWAEEWQAALASLNLHPPLGISLPSPGISQLIRLQGNKQSGFQAACQALCPLDPLETPSLTFRPAAFAWNQAAWDWAGDMPNLGHGGPDATRKANSRSFSLALEQEFGETLSGWDSALGLKVKPGDDLSARLRERDWTQAVFKGEHGLSGMANVFLETGNRKALAQAENILRRCGSGVLEPRHALLREYGWLYSVDALGVLGPGRGHALFCDTEGQYLGIQIAPEGKLPELVAKGFQQTAQRVAKALASLGYAGPIGQDGYEYRGPQGVLFRPLSDLNARHTMAAPGHGLSRRLPGKHIALWMLSARKSGLPQDESERRQLLHGFNFDPAKGVGAAWISPGCDALGKPALRQSLVLVAATEQDLEGMKMEMRRRCRI